MLRLPQKGMPKEELFAKLESYRSDDLPWREGRTWAYVYDAGAEAEAVIKHAYMSYLSENGLDPTAFPSLLRFENELISMAASHLGGDDEVVGNFTSGGTESIILAVKTAREHARAKGTLSGPPEMILPVTAHAAFQKACAYLDVKPVLVPIDPQTFKADVAKMREAITDNTILLVGSAISFAHGVVDPIEEIGKLALEHDILFHVDGCMGGFLLPYFRRLGADVPPFDFSVPGVTSISMDFHKYAFAAKGASVILHRNKDLRKHQIFSCAQWTGYTVVNPTVQSTKSGGPLAAAWAVLHFIGDEGYMEMARKMYEGTQKLVEALPTIEGLRLLAKPQMNQIAFVSDDASVFHIADEMKTRGWHIQPQLGFQDSKENIHLQINPSATRWLDDFIKDLKESVAVAKTMESGHLSATIRDAFASVDPADLDEEVFNQMLAMAGMQGVGLPERMAEINEVLNALPSKLNEQLLTQFLNNLFTQPSDTDE